MKAAKRNSLPKGEFVYPATKSYPIDTVARARNALARAAQSQTKGDYATVARKVKAKYGDQIEIGGQSKTPTKTAKAAGKPAKKTTTSKK